MACYSTLTFDELFEKPPRYGSNIIRVVFAAMEGHGSKERKVLSVDRPVRVVALARAWRVVEAFDAAILQYVYC